MLLIERLLVETFLLGMLLIEKLLIEMLLIEMLLIETMLREMLLIMLNIWAILVDSLVCTVGKLLIQLVLIVKSFNLESSKTKVRRCRSTLSRKNKHVTA